MGGSGNSWRHKAHDARRDNRISEIHRRGQELRETPGWKDAVKDALKKILFNYRPTGEHYVREQRGIIFNESEIISLSEFEKAGIAYKDIRCEIEGFKAKNIEDLYHEVSALFEEKGFGDHEKIRFKKGAQTNLVNVEFPSSLKISLTKEQYTQANNFCAEPGQLRS